MAPGSRTRSAEWQDAHLHNGCERRNARAGLRRLRGSKRVVSEWRTDLVRHPARSIRRRPLEARLLPQRRLAEAFGIRDLRPAPLFGWPVDHIQWQNGQAGALPGLCRGGPGVRCCRRERLDRHQRRWRCAGLVASKGISCTSGPIAMALLACGRNPSIRRRKQPTGAPLSIQHFHSRGLSWEEPAPRRARHCSRARQDCLQSGRAHWQHLDDGDSRAGR